MDNRTKLAAALMLADSLDPSLTKEAARGDMLKKMVNALVNRGANATLPNAAGAINRLSAGTNYKGQLSSGTYGWPDMGASIKNTINRLMLKAPPGTGENLGNQKSLAQLTGKSPFNNFKRPSLNKPGAKVSDGQQAMEISDNPAHNYMSTALNRESYQNQQFGLQKLLGEGMRF